MTGEDHNKRHLFCAVFSGFINSKFRNGVQQNNTIQHTQSILFVVQECEQKAIYNKFGCPDKRTFYDIVIDSIYLNNIQIGFSNIRAI